MALVYLQERREMEVEYQKKGLKMLEDKFKLFEYKKEAVSVGIIKDIATSFNNQLEILRRQKESLEFELKKEKIILRSINSKKIKLPP
jgi:hypothetical protein